ncbi:uncharacterized protein LOC127805329 [Diospyros lotus]|uniref:uncharacterized protein LOC127805329 n=1 Tax=Diospyros lotus TaxID=55363 RepID=UPI00224CDF77|nr:uncharacterized protein LOC127805329 [Diospyros lotus]
MDNRRQASASSSSSFTDLFAPNDSSSSSSSSSTGLFGSVFGPPSMGLRRDCSQPGAMAKHDVANQYGNGKHGTTTSDNISYRGKGESCGVSSKDKSSIYHSEPAEPCYFSSSIYYGGQEVYSPVNQPTASQHIVKKDGGDDPHGSNLNGASRGNWWQGSLYY